MADDTKLPISYTMPPKAFFVCIALVSCATLPGVSAQKAQTSRPVQKTRKQPAKPRKPRPRPRSAPKPHLLTTTQHHVVLTTLGASIILPIWWQVDTDPKHHIKVLMNPLHWGKWTLAWVTLALITNICAALYMAYLYTKTYKLKLTYPRTTHTACYLSLCLEGTLATFFVLLLTESNTAGGFEFGKVISSLPILVSLALCLGTAYTYRQKVERQIQQIQAQRAKEAAAKKQAQTQKKSFLGGIFGWNGKQAPQQTKEDPKRSGRDSNPRSPA